MATPARVAADHDRPTPDGGGRPVAGVPIDDDLARHQALGDTPPRRAADCQAYPMAHLTGVVPDRPSMVMAWGSVCHHVEREASRFIPSTLLCGLRS